VNRAFVVGLVLVIACATAGRDASNGDGNVGDGKTADAKQIDANLCATLPCDILTQCGCGSGACDIDGTDLMGTACRMITTPGHETSTCTGPSGCDKSYVCLGGATDASCHKYCTADADCGTPRGQCVIDIQSGGTPIAGIPSACSSNCDPANNAAPAVCPSTMKCSIFTATHLGTPHDISDCQVAGAGTQNLTTGTGTSCKSGTNGDDTLCAANHLCTTFDSGTPVNFNCRRICTFPATQCGSRTCAHFSTPLMIGGTEYGVCN